VAVSEGAAGSPPFYGVFNSSRPFAVSSAEGRLKLLFSFEGIVPSKQLIVSFALASASIATKLASSAHGCMKK
ncbi:hypothetical protein, partial [Halalkalibacterium halodurans]|uniref:hypothetical protein n=1 Tax=Halalkalibacterium halodurans TaxID=86665 RepID=UPI001ABB863C